MKLDCLKIRVFEHGLIEEELNGEKERAPALQEPPAEPSGNNMEKPSRSDATTPSDE